MADAPGPHSLAGLSINWRVSAAGCRHNRQTKHGKVINI